MSSLVHRLVCCLCLGSPPVLPVRPHAHAFERCVCLMCLDCYHAWRHAAGWDEQPPCPCCREPVHLGAVPPDPIAGMLLAEEMVTCVHCDVECPAGTLLAHRGACVPLGLRWLRNGHCPGRIGGCFCLARPGPDGYEPPCLAVGGTGRRTSALRRRPGAVKGCQWAVHIHRLLNATGDDRPVLQHVQDVLRHAVWVPNYMRFPPLRDLFERAGDHPDRRDKLLHIWEAAHSAGQAVPQWTAITAIDALLGGHPNLYRAAGWLVADALRGTRHGEVLRELRNPGNLRLLKGAAAMQPGMWTSPGSLRRRQTAERGVHRGRIEWHPQCHHGRLVVVCVRERPL